MTACELQCRSVTLEQVLNEVPFLLVLLICTHTVETDRVHYIMLQSGDVDTFYYVY